MGWHKSVYLQPQRGTPLVEQLVDVMGERQTDNKRQGEVQRNAGYGK